MYQQRKTYNAQFQWVYYKVKDDTFLYVSLFITWIIRLKLFVKIAIILIIMQENGIFRDRAFVSGRNTMRKSTSRRCMLDFRYVPRKDLLGEKLMFAFTRVANKIFSDSVPYIYSAI